MNFRELLKSHGLGIRALSAKTNLSHNCLQRLIVQGNCTVQTIVRLSEAMLIPPCVILNALLQTRQTANVTRKRNNSLTIVSNFGNINPESISAEGGRVVPIADTPADMLSEKNKNAPPELTGRA